MTDRISTSKILRIPNFSFYEVIDLKTLPRLDQHVLELGQIIQEIIRRFQNANRSISRGPHTQLSHHEQFLLEVLGDKGAQMMKEVALQLGIAVNTLTGIVDALETKELVSRSRSLKDRRVVFIELTPKGSKIYKSATKAKNEFHRANLANLTPQERVQLLSLFQKMAQLNLPDQAKLATKTPNSSKGK